jgi:hypothetical protein
VNCETMEVPSLPALRTSRTWIPCLMRHESRGLENVSSLGKNFH